MTGPTDLSPDGVAGWLRLLAGLALFLAPGVAAADRLLPAAPWRWVTVPVFSFTLMPVAMVLLDAVLGVPLRPGVTVLLAVALTAAFAAHRIHAGLLRVVDA